MNLLYNLPEDLKEKIVIQTTILNKKELLKSLPRKDVVEEAPYSVVCFKVLYDRTNEIYDYFIYHFDNQESQYDDNMDDLIEYKNTSVITRNINIGFSWYDLLISDF
tara:strand:+ start:632 stop:952 length:321 start_codon:yes stop_codon:yes gene_type:complete